MGVRSRLLAVGLVVGAVAGAKAAPALADQAGVCGQAGGAWQEHGGQNPLPSSEPRCEFQEDLSDSRRISASFPVPEDLVGDEWVESQLVEFLRDRVAALRAAVPAIAQTLAVDIVEHHQVYAHSASVKSLVFDERTNAMPLNPQERKDYQGHEFTTLTFDLAEHKRLKIADLFKDGTNVQSAITPLVLRYAPKGGLDQLSIGGANDGTYTAFALAPNELVVYLPRTRNGSADAGAFTTRIPLSAFGDTLRPEYR